MRLSKHLTSFIIALVLPFSSGAAWAQADPQLAEAQRLFKLGQYAQALGKADAHIFSKPREPQGRFVKGLILAEMKRTNEAIVVFRKLTEDFPELPEPFNNLAVLYAQEKQYDKARQALEAAIKTHPSYSVAHENLGDVYSKLASQAYGKALQIDSNNPVAQNKLALIRDLISVTVKQTNRPTDSAKTNGDPIKLASNDPAKPLAALAPPPVVASPPAPAQNNRLVAPAVVAPTPVTAPTPTPTPAAVTVTAVPAKPVVQATPPTSPTPPAQTSPAPGAVKAASPDEVSKTVHAWAAAWSKKDVKNYLASYSPEFVPPGGLTRKAWESERAARLTKPGQIEVGVENAAVTLQGNDRATVKFRQNYKSANLKTSASKILLLVRSKDRWLIREERVN